MDKDHRDLVRRLFTQATEILEDTHEPVFQGQGLSLRTPEYKFRAALLLRSAKDLEAVAGAIAAVLSPTPRAKHKS